MSTDERGWLPDGTTQGDLADGDFAWLSDAYKAGNQSKTEGRKLPYKIQGKVNEAGWKAAWSRAHQMSAADFAGGPSREAVMRKLMADKPAGVEAMNALLPEVEIRNAVDLWQDTDLEIRALEDGDGMTFEGYAAVFNRASQPIPMPGGSFIERIRPGAFTKSLSERKSNIRMFLNHNADNVLATTRARTLTLEEDDRGLHVQARLPDTQAGRDLSALIKRGDVDSMSFGFATVRDSWNPDYSERELVEVKLFEVSPVTGWPAYTDTQAFVRHLAEEAHEDEGPLAEAFRILQDRDARLTEQQRDLLVAAVNAHTDVLYAPRLAYWREVAKTLQ